MNEIVAATIDATAIAACDVLVDAASCGIEFDWELVSFMTRPFTAPLESVERDERLHPVGPVYPLWDLWLHQVYTRLAREMATSLVWVRRPVSELEQEQEPQQQHLPYDRDNPV